MNICDHVLRNIKTQIFFLLNYDQMWIFIYMQGPVHPPPPLELQLTSVYVKKICGITLTILINFYEMIFLIFSQIRMTRLINIVIKQVYNNYVY